jgi:alkylated DNA nucleotide flippase Atl1
MSRVDAEFAQRVYELVAQIPQGRVMTRLLLCVVLLGLRGRWVR